MSQPMNLIVQEPPLDRNVGHDGAPEAASRPRPAINLIVHEELAAAEADWRAFEPGADCTVFQTFDWIAAWHRSIGLHSPVNPAVVVGRRADGEILFLLPLAIHPGFVRRLTFLGHEVCDYNAPLLGAEFSRAVTREHFLALWSELLALLQRHPRLRHDIVELGKMPAMVGAQANPLLHLDVRLNPSGAHLTHLTGTWDEFYAARRSSATRRRDRTKRKRLGEMGEVRFVTPEDPDDIARTLETLMAQKIRAFARMGVFNVFARPGCRDFFFDLATNPATRPLVHVSRLEVGPIWAAANLGLQFRGCYYHVLASYDEGEVSRFGPGAAHLRDLMQRAVERGFDTFDFTIGDERYKLEWSDTVVTLHDHIVATTLRGWPTVVAANAVRRLKRAIKQTPFLWQAVSRARAALGSLRARSGRAEDGAAAHGEKSPPDRAGIDRALPMLASSGGRCARGRRGWYSWVGSNHRPPVPQTGALTN